MRSSSLRIVGSGSLYVVSRDGASGASTPSPDTRDIDDPARLVEEAAAQREKTAAELRVAPLPIETEPATTYRA